MHFSRVRADIIGSLKMRDPCVSIGSFDRKNIFYGVKSFNRGVSFVDELVQEVSKFVATSGSTVIYCTTIKDVEQVCYLISPSKFHSFFSLTFSAKGLTFLICLRGRIIMLILNTCVDYQILP